MPHCRPQYRQRTLKTPATQAARKDSELECVAIPSAMAALPCILQTPNCCGNMRKFSLPWQQGSVGASLNDTTKLADPQKTHWRTRIWHLTPIQAQLYPVLSQNSPIFVTMATGIGPGQVWMIPLNWTTPRTPVWYKNLGHIHTDRVIANFLEK